MTAATRWIAWYLLPTCVLASGGATACGSLIGLDDYSIGDQATGGATGATGGAAGATGGSPGGSGGSGMGGGAGGVECTSDAQCSDGVSCTEDSCNGGTCVHVDVSNDVELVNESLALGNGSFEFGMLPEPGPWQYLGEFDLVYNCGDSGAGMGCAGINGTTYAGHGLRALWLAGEDSNEDEAFQLFTLPADAQSLRIAADINFQTQNTSPTNADVFEVWLKDVGGTPLMDSALWTRDASQAQASGTMWTPDGLDVEVDVTAYAGTVVRVSFQSVTNMSQRTDFFLDDIRISVVTCP